MEILGFTEDTTTCDCCGRVELKGTYVMDDNKGGIYHYGSTCGVKAAGLSDSKELNKEVKRVEFNNKFISLKSDSQKSKLADQALTKGLYTKNELFEKFGELILSTPWEKIYEIGQLQHIIKK